MIAQTVPFADSTDRGDMPAVWSCAAIALLAALYSVVRFGFPDGGHVFAAALVFVVADITRLLWLRKLPRGEVWEALVIFLQIGVLAILFLAPAPFGVASDVPPQMLLFQTPTLVLLLCFIASSASAARPALLWCAGAAVLGLWTVAWHIILADPHVLTQSTIHPERYKSAMSLLRAVNQPEYFNLNLLKGAYTAGAMITLVLGFGIYRIRRLARVTSEHELARRALAAYFSPQIVDAILATQQNKLGPQEKKVAILDCDLVGYTALAESSPPEEVAGVLQAYRSLVEAAVFAGDGGILSYTGDGVVAVFGMTGASADAPGRAMTCAQQIAGDWAQLSGTASRGKVLPLAVGVEFGPVQMGFVGKGRAMSLLVLGEAVEAAAALQWATREARTDILVGQRAHDSLLAENPAMVSVLQPCPVGGIDAWCLPAR